MKDQKYISKIAKLIIAKLPELAMQLKQKIMESLLRVAKSIDIPRACC